MTEAIQFGAGVARDYDDGRALPDEIAEAVHVRIVAATGLVAAFRVLDAGAGTGTLAQPFLREGCKYVGLDASAAMLGVFRSGDDARARGRLVQGDVRGLPFHEASFDAVLAFRVFGVVPGWRRGVQECLRVLRPGGHLVVGRIQRGPSSLHAFLRSERNRLLAAAGVDTRRPGADDDAVLAALAAEAELGCALEPVAWTARTTYCRQVKQNLSGWRVQALPASKRTELKQELMAACEARYGSADATVEEPAEIVLHVFRKG